MLMNVQINCYGVVCAGWDYIHPRATADHLGYLPSFIDITSPTPLAEQINANYQSGWNSFGQGQWRINRDAKPAPTLQYPGDPTLFPIAMYHHKPTDETLYFYDASIACIMQKDGKFDVARID